MDFPRPSMSASELFGDLKDFPPTLVSAAVVRIVATITTMIPTTTTMPIPSQLRVLMILVTIRIPTAILMIAWNIPRVPRGLPVLQVRDRAASLRLSW